MGFLFDVVLQCKFEIQCDIVKNECVQNYDNCFYGLMWEKMGEVFYFEGYFYFW